MLVVSFVEDVHSPMFRRLNGGGRVIGQVFRFSGYVRDRKCGKEVKSVRKREYVGRRVRVEGS